MTSFIVGLAIGFVFGLVVGYLFKLNNPEKSKKIDSTLEKVKSI